MIFSIFLTFFLSIGIFLAGMLIMSRSIISLSNKKLKKWIFILTNHPISGILVGMIVTAFIQSSSATTVLVVSIVNSNLMNLYQATFVIMGSNIGTTFTGQLINFNFYFLIPHILILGIVLFSLNFNIYIKNIGKFLIGFSFLFLGMKMITYSLSPLKDYIEFKEMLSSIENQPIHGIAIGIIITALIQSSSIGIAIIQGLAFQGMITIYQATPIILGQNIGTCVTTILSSLATDKNGKRAAVIHLLFNILGALIIYPFIHLFSDFIYSLTPKNSVHQIANANSLLNVVNVIVLLPFIHPMVYISKKLIR